MLDLLGSAHVLKIDYKRTQTRDSRAPGSWLDPHPILYGEKWSRGTRKTAPRATHTAAGNNVDFPLPRTPPHGTAERGSTNTIIRNTLRLTFAEE